MTDLETIAAAFDGDTWQHGLAHYRNGDVVVFEALRHDRAKALVQGDRARAHRVFLEWPNAGERPDGDCDCPAEFDCEHVVAALAAWLDAVDGSAVTESEPTESAMGQVRGTNPPAANARRSDTTVLLYVIHPVAEDGSVLVALHVGVKGKLRSDGGYFAPRAFRLRESHWRQPPRFITDGDLEHLRWLEREGQPLWPAADRSGEGGATHYWLPREAVAPMLRQFVPSDRCYWEHTGQPPLRPGAARPGQLHWRLRADARQRLEPVTDPRCNEVLLSSELWYRDGAVVGPVAMDLPRPVLEALGTWGWLAPEEATAAAARLADDTTELVVPKPHALTHRECTPSPRPVLRLTCRRGLPPEALSNRLDASRHLVAELAFDYVVPEDTARVGADDPANCTHLLVGRARVRIVRDAAQEAECVRRLDSLEGLPDDGNCPPTEAGEERQPPVPGVRLYTAGTTEDDWLAFTFGVVPELIAEGWRVEAASDFPYPPVVAEDWDAHIIPRTDGGWFDLGLGVTVDGERIELLPLLLSALRELPQDVHDALLDEDGWTQGHLPVPLPDGRRLAMPVARLRPLLATLVELYDCDLRLDRSGRLRVRAMDACRLVELAQAGWSWNGPNALRRLGERLRQGAEAVSVPTGLRAELRPYQQTGLNWLQLLCSEGFGGVLADDMGLGKTVQVLAHILVEKEAGRLDRPCLVVVPTSLLVTWEREVRRFAPDLRIVRLHGARRNLGAVPDADLVVTSYGVLRSDVEGLAELSWHLVILDEAQHIKNPRSHAARALRRLEAHQRLCLTGTPIENHLGELWSLFHFLMPGFLGDEAVFRRRYRRPIEEQGDEWLRERLAQRVRPFVLRRTKAAVTPELPVKTQIQRVVEMTGDQRDLYEGIRVAVHRDLQQAMADKGLEGARIELLDALLKLRQVCCDPRLVRDEADIGADHGRHAKAPSAKLEALCELLPGLIEDGRRVLVFSQFTSMLRLIEARLPGLGIEWVKLTGRTRDRDAVVDRFQAAEVPLMLISLKAGGTGLNLTAADTVIHYDPWWNPAVEDQATDRAHRIGQDKPVFVYRLICAGTVEERIQHLQAGKAALAEGLYDTGADADSQEGNGPLAAADLEALLAEPESARMGDADGHA
ncbi:MAG: DEAD/DEAH box helicase [Spiribacter salinus]|uniref:DEAD/DEAH box helicase n=1 Tax=Spiribacter salinus TaxID=1335746 RepID=A0A540VR12_9GAMM|nr:MAG: DEAD/DEAH box helicase [Spiribacter salinus]